VVRPVPIPNTAVKHSLADGSGFIDSARVGCRQFFLKGRSSDASAFFMVPAPTADPFGGDNPELAIPFDKAGNELLSATDLRCQGRVQC
jgi:hypothetical protein